MAILPGIQGDVRYRSWLVGGSFASYVFLHGAGEHAGLYEPFAEELNEGGIDVWAADQDVVSLDDLSENTRRLGRLARLERPDRPLVIAGHGLGAVTVLATIARDPSPYAAAVLSGTAELGTAGDELSLPVLRLPGVTVRRESVAQILEFVREVARRAPAGVMSPIGPITVVDREFGL